MQADQVMRMLAEFVTEFENFMIWIKEQPAESEESIRWFESIFSVTEQTQLLRNIQDIKDELGMLKAVFDDQIQVLTSASEHIEQANFQCMHGCSMTEAAIHQSIKCIHSSKIFVDQSSKHLKHVERMQIQANQAYDTVYSPRPVSHSTITRFSAERSPQPQTATSIRARSARKSQRSNFVGSTI
jgi:hypothetical protein